MQGRSGVEEGRRTAELGFAAPRRLIAAHPRPALFVLALAFLIFWGLPTLIVPLSTDEVIYALGARVVLQGGQLYRDYWDIKPPFIYLTYALPMGLGGTSLVAFRLFDLLCIGVGMTGVFLLTCRYFGNRAGLFAACLFSFSYFAVAWFGDMGEAESYMAGPLVLGFVAYRMEGRYTQPAAFAAGLLLGIATAFKLSAALLCLGLPAMELLLRQEGWTASAAARRLALAFAGFVAVQAAWVGYLNVAGVWSSYVDIQRNYTIPYNRFHYPENVPFPRLIVESIAGWLGSVPYLTAPAWAAVLIGLVRGGRGPLYLFSILLGLAALSVGWQGKFFDYHWVIMIPLLAPLAGYAIDQAIELMGTLAAGRARAGYAVLALGLCVFGVLPIMRHYDTYRLLYERATGSISEVGVENRYMGEFALNRELVEYIDANGAPGDSLFVYGFWTYPYFWADRPLPTRFVTSASVRSKWSPAAWRRELIDDLEKNKPRYIAVAAGDNEPWLTGNGETSDQSLCDSFPELRAFMEQNYHAVLNNGLFVLYDSQAPEHLVKPRCVL